MTPWEIHGHSLNNCNCATGCPCQFMALPTYGHCEAIAVFQVDSGHYGDVDLTGMRSALVVKWPGPIHEGNGTMQIVIDEGATPEQRDAMHKIMVGEDTEEMATMWWVFSMMSPNKLETLYKPIEVEIDMESRRGHAKIPEVLETVVEPLLNPVTGAEHRARIDMPHGFEFRLAEMAKGTTKTFGAIDLPKNQDTHVHLIELHLSNTGVLEAA